REGVLRAMRSMHSEKAVDGLIRKLATARSKELRRDVLATLIRLYHREADYKGSWWGIRPDNSGPYYDRQEWAQSKRIGAVLTSAVLDGDDPCGAFRRAERARHTVGLEGLPAGQKAITREEEKPITIAKAGPRNPDHIGNMTYESAVKRALRAKGDAAKGAVLSKSQSCLAC